jgi:hypothetical protein
MPLRKNINTRSASQHRVQLRRRCKFGKKKPSRSATLDSLDSVDSHTDEAQVSPNIDSLGFNRTKAQNDSADFHRSEAQVIPFQHIDEWALFIYLENRFGADNFKIEVRMNSSSEDLRG